MEDLFVPYDLAVKLKDIGFDEGCLARYRRKQFQTNTLCNLYDYNNSPIVAGDISAPLWQQVTDWFRVKHDVDSHIDKIIGGGTGLDEVYFCRVFRVHGNCEDFDITTNYVYGTYEDARLKGVEKLIEIVLAF